MSAGGATIPKYPDNASWFDTSGTGAGPFVPRADNEPSRATYAYSAANITPAATPTDLLTIKGSGVKTVRIKSIIISGIATSASNIIVNFVRRTAANTGGTSSAPTPALHDTADPAAFATLALYSANPSGLGTGITLHSFRLNLAPAANGSVDRLMMQYTWQNEKPIVLNGLTEWLAINLGGVAFPAGGALDIDVLWTEDG